MYSKILLIPGAKGVDEPAVRRALSLAESFGSEIEVFDPVYEPLLEGYYGRDEIYEPLRRRVVAERLEAAETIAEAIRHEGHKARADAVWDHPIEQTIVRRANAHDVDLIVTQSLEGRGRGLSHADWRLLATSPVPVLIVNGEAREAYRHIVAAVDPVHAHAKPAELDEAILAQAKALQGQLHAELEVVHCFIPLTELSAAGADATDLPIEAAEQALEDARRHEVEALVRQAGLATSTIRLESGRPDRVLGRKLAEGRADLVIMGALSRGRLRDFVIGSTAERLLHEARGDIMAVKPAAPTNAS